MYSAQIVIVQYYKVYDEVQTSVYCEMYMYKWVNVSFLCSSLFDVVFLFSCSLHNETVQLCAILCPNPGGFVVGWWG